MKPSRVPKKRDPQKKVLAMAIPPSDSPDAQSSNPDWIRLRRRHFLQGTTTGIGSAAIASLLGQDQTSASAVRYQEPGVEIRQGGQPGLPGLPHFAPKAKRVVVLWQGGGPSHVDLFDPKPEL